MSKIKSTTIHQKDGYNTQLLWITTDQKKPKGSILILHGMAEHVNRYYTFAKMLSEDGFDVYYYNHRGHGTDKKISDLGYIADSNGDQILIEDAITISNYIEKNNRSNKFFLFGHSMGSLIARNLLYEYDRFNGVIISGTTHPPKLQSYLGLFYLSLHKKIKGAKHISPSINTLLFGGKNYTALSDRTAYDWLSRSHPIVGSYIHDPFCGFLCTTSFYYDLVKLALNASNNKSLRLARKDLHYYIISGMKDPVSNYGKEIKKLLQMFRKYEYQHISYNLYPDCRHELLNERNNEEVYSDLIKWLHKRL